MIHKLSTPDKERIKALFLSKINWYKINGYTILQEKYQLYLEYVINLIRKDERGES